MCTLTIHKIDSGFHITMNRDESLDRGIEIQPFEWDNGIYAPQDSNSKGTWIGMNPTNGRWACLLNGYAKTPMMRDFISRGDIVPQYLTKELPRDFKDYRSFRLIYGDKAKALELYWDGSMACYKDIEWQDNWLMRTSSSYRQEDVKSYRQSQFNTWLSNRHYVKNTHIPMFHLQQDDHSMNIDVLMHRPELNRATTSLTHMIITKNQTDMHYYAGQNSNISHLVPLAYTDMINACAGI